MKLAISNIAWNDNHNHYYTLMQRCGFTGLEIAPTKFSSNPYDNLAVAEQVKKDLLQYSLSVVSMQSLLFGTDGLALFTTTEARDQLKAYLKKAILYAEVIGCPVLVFGNPKNRIARDLESQYSIALEFFKELGNFAHVHNTCLCIEPNPEAYGTNFINTLAQANQLVNDVDSLGFAMIIDSSTMLINQDSPTSILDVLPNTKHIHLSMPFLKPLNQDFDKYANWIDYFIKTIKSSTYPHYLSIEMANVAPEDINQSLDILRKLAESNV